MFFLPFFPQLLLLTIACMCFLRIKELKGDRLTKTTPRCYQNELFEAQMMGNTIAYLPTGSGKVENKFVLLALICFCLDGS